MVYVLDTCGTPEMRRFLQGKPIVDVLGISPNPATNDVRVTITSRAPMTAQILWIDALGRSITAADIPIQTGVHEYELNAPRSSGSYILQFSLLDHSRLERRVEVIR
jgi:hypothetical protein